MTTMGVLVDNVRLSELVEAVLLAAGFREADAAVVAEVLVERFVLGFFEVHKTKGENQKIGLG